MGFALGSALAGLAANASGLASGLERAGVANAAFWTPARFIGGAALATAAALRLTRKA